MLLFCKDSVGASLWIRRYLPTADGTRPNLTWTSVECAEGCLPKDRCKLLLAIGAGEVLPMAFAVAPFPCALLALGMLQHHSTWVLLWPFNDSLCCTWCCLHSHLFQPVKPPQEGAGRNKAFQTWVSYTWFLLLKSKYLYNKLQNP